MISALQQRVCENFAVVSQYKEVLELSEPLPLKVYRVGYIAITLPPQNWTCSFLGIQLKPITCLQRFLIEQDTLKE